MAEVQRRLAAIMFTDIVGYVSATQQDESLALELLDQYRRLLRPLFSDHGGTEIKTIGDGILVELPSALAAVQCAVEIQEVLKDYNDSQPKERRIRVRIGIHLGDVEYRDHDLYGDAVNVASRIEPLAEAGGICISESVFVQVRTPLVSLGERELKNVIEPVEVYRVVLPWEKATSQRPVTHRKPRLAVLPIVNISPDPENEYFSDGMTGELIFKLSQLGGLEVIAQTSAMKYKGTRKSIAEIGGELRVGTILEGSVRKAGRQLRITVQLTDAQTEGHLWSQAYDRELENVFAIQRDIAQRVADVLQAKLAAQERDQLAKRDTQSLEAYTLYLKGRYFWNKRTGRDMERAIECFQQAIALDPDYALAYAGLADVYNILPAFSTPTAFKEAYLQGKEAALQALRIDEMLAEAHASLALLKAQGDWDWEGAESEFKRAIELKPGYATAHHWYAIYLVTMRRFDEAIAQINSALELDPLSVIIQSDLGQVNYYAGNYDEAIEALQKAILMEPHFSYAHFFLGLAYAQKSMYEEALAAMKRAVTSSEAGFSSFIEAWLGLIHARMGNRDAAERALEILLKRSEKEHVPPTLLASLHFALGQADEGSEWLDQACEARDVFLFFTRMEPLCEQLRSSPRFAALLKRMGLEG